MSTKYSTTVICPLENRAFCDLEGTDVLTLEPNITNLMAESQNYNDLLYLWTTWHLESGRRIKDDYRIYVDLMQKLAEQNCRDYAIQIEINIVGL